MVPTTVVGPKDTNNGSPEHKSERTSPIPGVPMIMYNGDKPSNLPLMIEIFIAAMISKHGEIANVLRTGVDHVEPEIPMPQKTGDKEVDQINMSRWGKAMERRDDRIEKNNAQLIRLFGDVILQLSSDSFEKTKEHPEFEKVNAKNSPVLLWKIIVEVHTFKDKQDGGESKLAALYTFYFLFMSPNETIYDFKRAIDTALQGFILTRQEPPGVDVQVEHFITRLDPNRYGQLQLAYKNRLREKPQTLLEAYAAARDHCVIRAHGGSTAISNAATNLMNATGTATMMVVTRENQGVDTAKKETRPRGREQEETEAPARDSTRPPTRDCYLCADLKGKDRRHWTNDCPRLSQVLALVKDGTIKCAFADDETSDEEFLDSVCL